ncbi:alpha/beta-hydrolase [Schizophyllum commune Loenen D]|nr:alpha/beta-hydrolase [Schizophyllum commune Loenen D]
MIPLLAATLSLAATVQLNGTTLIGTDISSGVAAQEWFAGIPYAEPPVGQLRFRPPVAKALTEPTLDATAYGPGCPQPDVLGVAYEDQAEDCLTVNVLRPANTTSDARLPVVCCFPVSVYGGGFHGGSARLFNATEFVAQSVSRGTPVIYVNFNYRLGPLGFPKGGEMESKGTLNVGLKDSLLAFQWINRNIAAFGGDPAKVTAVGSSAGSITIQILSLQSSFTDYIRAAIYQSGFAATSTLNKATVNPDQWKSFVNAAGCGWTYANALDCLQSADTGAIMNATWQVVPDTSRGWFPNFDGDILPELPSRIWSSGAYARIPFIAGTHLDDGTRFTPTFVKNDAEVRVVLNVAETPALEGYNIAQLDKHVSKILELYPNDPSLGSPYNTGNETFGLSPQYKRLASIMGDINFESQRRLWQAQTAAVGVASYGYLFTDPQIDAEPRVGVPHGAIVDYMYYRIPDESPQTSWTLSSQIMDYYLSFATSLTPNDGLGVARVEWPEWSSDSKVLMQLDGENLGNIPDTYRQEQIEYLNSDPGLLHHRAVRQHKRAHRRKGVH